jgi:hypothetical protein
MGFLGLIVCDDVLIVGCLGAEVVILECIVKRGLFLKVFFVHLQLLVFQFLFVVTFHLVPDTLAGFFCHFKSALLLGYLLDGVVFFFVVRAAARGVFDQSVKFLGVEFYDLGNCALLHEKSERVLNVKPDRSEQAFYDAQTFFCTVDVGLGFAILGILVQGGRNLL